MLTNPGLDRCIRASSVVVTSLTTAAGVSTDSGKSILDAPNSNLGYAGTVYTPGATIVAADHYAGTPYKGLGTLSTGAFGSSTNTTGIHGFTTLLEAACAQDAWNPLAQMNLAALGL